MFLMRYTVIDPQGTASFVAPCTALKALVAACASAPSNVNDLLSATAPYDSDLKEYVLNSLALFDEHNANGRHDQIHFAINYADEQRTHHQIPAFRVVDEVTREASLQPVKAGLVLFNLKDRRIIQLQNTYAEVRREDRGRVHQGGEPTSRLYKYRLPMEWQILP
jgi:hypothetical protein